MTQAHWDSGWKIGYEEGRIDRVIENKKLITEFLEDLTHDSNFDYYWMETKDYKKWEKRLKV